MTDVDSGFGPSKGSGSGSPHTTESGPEASQWKDAGGSGEAGRPLPPAAVEFEPAAESFIRERGAGVTIRASRRHGCCGGTAFVPMAEVGAPEPGEEDQYLSREERGITVWIHTRFLSGESGFREGGARRDVAPPRQLARAEAEEEEQPVGPPLRIGLDGLLGFRRLRVEGPGIST